MVNDKELEKRRYEAQASVIAERFDFDLLADYLKEPYIFYMNRIVSLLKPGHKILELGSGTGNFTQFLLRTNATIIASDISPKSLEVLKNTYSSDKLTCIVLDMEELIEENEFDFIVSAGSLSYGDNLIVMDNIYRALKPGGIFVCVDSLDNNWVYRLNRLYHYFSGDRSLSTLRRMPNAKLLECYDRKFGDVTLTFFGSLVWLAPFLRLFWRNAAISRILKRFDSLVGVKYSAFKFVMVARKVE
jgi:SAM-dependent methyltransferase